MKVNQIAIVDVETTASEHFSFGGNGRVIQWGMILLDVEHLGVMMHRQTLVHLGEEWFADADPEAMRIHGITKEDVQASPRTKEALELMFEDPLINWNRTCFASWGSFDLEMLRGEYACVLGRRPPVKYRALDVRSVCGGVDLCLSDQEPEWEYVGSRRWAENHAVSLAADLQHIAGDKGPHDALYDCAVIAACLRRAMRWAGR